jgi:hypothetical protein
VRVLAMLEQAGCRRARRACRRRAAAEARGLAHRRGSRRPLRGGRQWRPGARSEGSRGAGPSLAGPRRLNSGPPAPPRPRAAADRQPGASAGGPAPEAAMAQADMFYLRYYVGELPRRRGATRGEVGWRGVLRQQRGTVLLRRGRPPGAVSPVIPLPLCRGRSVPSERAGPFPILRQATAGSLATSSWSLSSGPTARWARARARGAGGWEGRPRAPGRPGLALGGACRRACAARRARAWRLARDRTRARTRCAWPLRCACARAIAVCTNMCARVQTRTCGPRTRTRTHTHTYTHTHTHTHTCTHARTHTTLTV